MRAIIIISCLLLFLSTVAQDGKNVFAFTDQQVYVTGERIWVSGALMNASEELEDVSVYLFNREAKMLEKQNLRAKDGKFYTGILLKGELPTDNYVIAVARGKTFKAFMPAMIINPVRPPLQQNGSVTQGVYVERRSSFPISINKIVFSRREAIEISIDPGVKDDIMVSVARKDALSGYADSLFSGWQFSTTDEVRRPFVNGDLVHARVTDANGAVAEGVNVIATLMGDPTEMARAVSDRNGDAVLHVPYHIGKLPMSLVAMHEQSERYRVNLIQEEEVYGFNFSLPFAEITQRFEDDIADRVVNAEAMNKYRADEKQQMKINNLDTTDFYGKPDKRYILDNYTRFPDMQEIIEEIIPEVRVRRPEGKAMLQVVDLPFRQFFETPALVLLDGIPVSDIDQLLKLDPLKLQSVDVVNRKFFIGDLRINGVVHYRSYKHDLAGYQPAPHELFFEHQGIELPIVPVFTVSADQRLPELRNLLFWREPGPLKGGKLNFSSTDAEGSYEVRMISIGREGISWGERIEFVVK